MGIIKRKNVWNDNGMTGFTWLLVFMTTGLVGTGITYWFESTNDSLITPESAPTLAGVGIEFAWVIVALISVISIFVFVAFGRAKPRSK